MESFLYGFFQGGWGEDFHPLTVGEYELLEFVVGTHFDFYLVAVVVMVLEFLGFVEGFGLDIGIQGSGYPQAYLFGFAFHPFRHSDYVGEIFVVEIIFEVFYECDSGDWFYPLNAVECKMGYGVEAMFLAKEEPAVVVFLDVVWVEDYFLDGATAETLVSNGEHLLVADC